MTATTTAEPESGSPATVAAFRSRALNLAALHLGVPALARALCIEDRSVRAKLGGDRGVSDADLTLTAEALRKRARALVEQADAIAAHLGER
jgi:hypothetical protein